MNAGDAKKKKMLERTTAGDVKKCARWGIATRNHVENAQKYVYIYVYLYIYIYTCVYIYIHILWSRLYWPGALSRIISTDSFWVLGRLIHNRAICTRIALLRISTSTGTALLWIPRSFQGLKRKDRKQVSSRTPQLVVRKIGSQNQSILYF